MWWPFRKRVDPIFSKEEERRILGAAEEIWAAEFEEPVAEVRIGKKSLRERHCDTPAVQVRNFRSSPRPGWVQEKASSVVCPVCLWGYVDTGPGAND